MNRRNFFAGLFGVAAAVVAPKVEAATQQRSAFDRKVWNSLRDLGGISRKQLCALRQRLPLPPRRLFGIEEVTYAHSCDSILYATRNDSQHIYAVKRASMSYEEALANLKTFLHPKCTCGIWRKKDAWHSIICQYHRDLGVEIGLGRHIVYDNAAPLIAMTFGGVGKVR